MALNIFLNDLFAQYGISPSNVQIEEDNSKLLISTKEMGNNESIQNNKQQIRWSTILSPLTSRKRSILIRPTRIVSPPSRSKEDELVASRKWNEDPTSSINLNKCELFSTDSTISSISSNFPLGDKNGLRIVKNSAPKLPKRFQSPHRKSSSKMKARPRFFIRLDCSEKERHSTC